VESVQQPRIAGGGAVLLNAWAHTSGKSDRFGLQELVGTHSTQWLVFSTSGLQQSIARIAPVKFISQEASRGGADCECKRTRFHAAELRFRVRQQPHVSYAARNLLWGRAMLFASRLWSTDWQLTYPGSTHQRLKHKNLLQHMFMRQDLVLQHAV